MKSALILFAHGARDPEWRLPFEKIQRKIAVRRPDLAVELAFLEIMQPSLPDAVARLSGAGHTHIIVAPMFMAQGGHLKRDLRQMLDGLRQRHPAIILESLPAVGDIEPILNAVSDWLVNSTRR
jgi:sirohydrochlorin cobaltochelatase